MAILSHTVVCGISLVFVDLDVALWVLVLTTAQITIVSFPLASPAMSATRTLVQAYNVVLAVHFYAIRTASTSARRRIHTSGKAMARDFNCLQYTANPADEHCIVTRNWVVLSARQSRKGSFVNASTQWDSKGRE